MGLLVSFVISICAIPIIRTLNQLERNTYELIQKANKFELYIDAIKKIS
jgi:hypothetical protein